MTERDLADYLARFQDAQSDAALRLLEIGLCRLPTSRERDALLRTARQLHRNSVRDN